MKRQISWLYILLMLRLITAWDNLIWCFINRWWISYKWIEITRLLLVFFFLLGTLVCKLNRCNRKIRMQLSIQSELYFCIPGWMEQTSLTKLLICYEYHILLFLFKFACVSCAYLLTRGQIFIQLRPEENTAREKNSFMDMRSLDHDVFPSIRLVGSKHGRYTQLKKILGISI